MIDINSNYKLQITKAESIAQSSDHCNHFSLFEVSRLVLRTRERKNGSWLHSFSGGCCVVTREPPFFFFIYIYEPPFFFYIYIYIMKIAVILLSGVILCFHWCLLTCQMSFFFFFFLILINLCNPTKKKKTISSTIISTNRREVGLIIRKNTF